MSLHNPDIRYAKSVGIDLPIMKVYLAGRIAGNCIEKCLKWRHDIINHYTYYKKDENGEWLSYPISFLDALNSKESDSVDAKGLTSAIPPNLIYDKDLLSVNNAHVLVANMDDYMTVGIEKELSYSHFDLGRLSQDELIIAFEKLQETIKERRPNWGTDCEISWALKKNKPLILIAANEYQKRMLEKHPFMRRASVIVGSVQELLEGKHLNILYKSIASSVY